MDTLRPHPSPLAAARLRQTPRLTRMARPDVTRQGVPSSIEISAMVNWPRLQALVRRWLVGRGVVKVEMPSANDNSRAADQRDEAQPRHRKHGARGRQPLLHRQRPRKAYQAGHSQRSLPPCSRTRPQKKPAPGPAAVTRCGRILTGTPRSPSDTRARSTMRRGI